MNGARGRHVMLAAALLIGAALPAFGQGSRFTVSLGGGYQSTAHDFSDTGTKTINAERATFGSSVEVAAAPSIDGAVGVTIWKQLGLRVGASRYSTPTPAAFEASIPHPFFFNQPRNLSGDVDGLTRDETSFDVHLAGVFALGNKMQATVFAGPTWLQVKQGMVTDFAFTESYPYDTATFSRAETAIATGSKMSFGGGAALGYFLTKNIGLEASGRVSQGEVPLAGTTGSIKAVKAGGFKAGLGLVARF